MADAENEQEKKGDLQPEGLTGHTLAEVCGNTRMLVVDADTV